MKRRLPTLHLLVAFVFVLAAVIAWTVASSSKTVSADSCTPPATTYGTATMTVTVPATGTYNIWVRMLSPSSSANSILLNIDNSTCYNAGGSSSIPANAWTWVNYSGGNTATTMKLGLSQGTHTFTLTGTQAGVGIDRIEALSDNNCTPTGTGDNCAPSSVTPPVVSFASPSSGGNVSGSSVNISANAASASGLAQVGIKNVVFKLDSSTTLATVDTGSGTGGSLYSTTWNSTSVANGTHTLTATATDTQGQSTSSSESISVSNSVACTANPSAPLVSVAAGKTFTSIPLTWTASSLGAGCTGLTYSVYNGGTLLASNLTTTSYTLTGLTPNTTYSNLTVKAIDGSGHSTSSAAISPAPVTLADTSAPTLPGSPTVSALNASQVNVSWQSSTDNLGVAGYKIYRTGGTGGATSFNVTSLSAQLSYTDNTVAAGTTYTYKISAYDAAANETTQVATTPATVTTPQATSTNPPNAPSSLASTLQTASTISLAWNHSTATSGNTLVGYRIYRSTGTQAASIVNTVSPSGATTESYVDTGLNSQASYTYYVVAFDNNGHSSTNSNNITVATLTATQACSNIADIYCDHVVNIIDVGILYGNFGRTSGATRADGDLNGDGKVNIIDVGILYGQYGAAY